MNINKIILSFVFVFVFLSLSAQSNYNEAIQQGDAAFYRSEYTTAIKKYLLAETFDQSKWKIVQEKLDKVYAVINTKIETLQTNLTAETKHRKDLQKDSIETYNKLAAVIKHRENLQADSTETHNKLAAEIEHRANLQADSIKMQKKLNDLQGELDKINLAKKDAKQKNTETITYTVQKEEGLDKIAKKNNTTREEILKLNQDIENPDDIKTGQKIFIPKK